MLASLLTTLFITGAAAIQVTSPGMSTVWSNTGSQTISWKAVSTDPDTFVVQLVNQVSEVKECNECSQYCQYCRKRICGVELAIVELRWKGLVRALGVQREGDAIEGKREIGEMGRLEGGRRGLNGCGAFSHFPVCCIA